MLFISMIYRSALFTFAVGALALASSATLAADLPHSIRNATGGPGTALICNDGHTYRLQARSISNDGDLVTGYLLHGRGGSHYLRLIPMGIGFRYSGQGVWLDGQGSGANLNFGPHRSIPCEIRDL